MTKDEIKIGGTYHAKVTDRVVPIRIDAENRHGGWDATNLVTSKRVRIKSAQRLCGPADKKGAKATATKERTDGAVAEAPAPEAVPVTFADAPAAEAGPVPPTQPDQGKKTAGKPKAAKPPKAPKEPKPPKALSCLDAAAEVLKTSKEPMQCKALIDAMHNRKLWTSDAPTPSATLYSAILREITKKGDASRFKKTDRGHFALNA